MPSGEYPDPAVFRTVVTHCERGHELLFFIPEEELIYRAVAYPNRCPICGWFYPSDDLNLPRRTTFSMQLDPFLHSHEQFRIDLRFYLTLRNSDGRWVRSSRPILAATAFQYISQLADLTYEAAVQVLIDEKEVLAKELVEYSWPRLAAPIQIAHPDESTESPSSGT